MATGWCSMRPTLDGDVQCSVVRHNTTRPQTLIISPSFCRSPAAPVDFGELTSAPATDQEMASASGDQFVEATNCEYCQMPLRSGSILVTY